MQSRPTLRSKEEIFQLVRKKSFLDMHGIHESPVGQRGLSFREAVPYNSGDDIRHLNWKMTARTQTPMINRFSEEREIPIVLVYLNSGGLHFGEVKSKHALAVEALTALGYAATHSKDGFATLFFDDTLAQWYPPSRQDRMVARNYDKGVSLDSLGKSVDLNKVIEQLQARIKRASVIFMIGDFLSFNKSVDFSRLASKHSLYMAIIRDKAEENITLRGTYDIIDPISQKHHSMQIDSKTSKRYAKLFKANDELLFRHFDRFGIAHQKLYTDQEPIDALKKLVRQS